MIKLTEQQAKGTYTVHLPLKRSPKVHPTATIVFVKEASMFRAGVSVCNTSDQFSKTLGRVKAYHKAVGAKAVVGDVKFILDELSAYFMEIEARKMLVQPNADYPLGLEFFNDLQVVCSELADRMKNK